MARNRVFDLAKAKVKTIELKVMDTATFKFYSSKVNDEHLECDIMACEGEAMGCTATVTAIMQNGGTGGEYNQLMNAVEQRLIEKVMAMKKSMAEESVNDNK